jgi:hypothetical protein
MIRPEVRALARRWADPAAGAALAGLGLWLVLGGGWLTAALGVALAALGAGWLVLALRRRRFAADPGAPGIVEIDEGRVRYLHPVLPGEISLDDLAELHLAHFRGRRVWRMVDTGGRGLVVPLDAAGAPALFDAFAALPGLDTAALVAALAPQGAGAGPARGLAPALDDRAVWVRRGAAVISFRDRTGGRA